VSAFVRRLAAAGPLAWAALALGLGAAALMVATELSTIHSVRLGETTCGAADPADRDKCLTSGGDQHGYALIVLALLCALMTFGAVLGRSKPAAVALAVIGAVVLFVALVLDLPTLDSTRDLELKYTGVEPQTGGAFTLELIAGGLALLAAAAAWALARRAADEDERARRSRRVRSERAAEESAA
jgi:LPXTG-motif cell wall-anchored protein